MVYYNFQKHKEFLFLDLVVYLIPFSIILGNLILNTILLTAILLFSILIFKKKIFNKYKNYFYFLFFLITYLLINLFLSSNFNKSAISILGFIRYYLFFLIILFCFENISNFKKNFTNIIFFFSYFCSNGCFVSAFFFSRYIWK